MTKINNTNNGERAERRRAAGVSGHEEQLRPCGSRPHTHCATLNHFFDSASPIGVCQRQLQSVKNLCLHRPCGLMLATGASAPSWQRATSYPLKIVHVVHVDDPCGRIRRYRRFSTRITRSAAAMIDTPHGPLLVRSWGPSWRHCRWVRPAKMHKVPTPDL